MEIAFHHQLRIDGDVRFAQRALVARQALGRIRVVGRAGHERDAAVPQFHQVAHGQVGAVFVVELEADGAFRRQQAARRDDGPLLREIEHALVRDASGQQDDAVDLPRQQQTDAVGLFLRIPVPADDDGRVARVFQAVVHAAQAFIEEGAGNILHHDADGHRAALFQALRHLVRRKFHVRDGRQHGVALVVGDPGRAVQNARDGAGRDAGLAGHVEQGGRGSSVGAIVQGDSWVSRWLVVSALKTFSVKDYHKRPIMTAGRRRPAQVGLARRA